MSQAYRDRLHGVRQTTNTTRPRARPCGWTAGAGIEAAISPNWTAKVEYLYVNLGSQSCPVGSCSTSGNPTDFPLTENVVRAGINYKFSW